MKKKLKRFMSQLEDTSGVICVDGLVVSQEAQTDRLDYDLSRWEPEEYEYLKTSGAKPGEVHLAGLLTQYEPYQTTMEGDEDSNLKISSSKKSGGTPPQILENLIYSMPNRIHEDIGAQGGHTHQ
ncbi:hypothetical protein PPACK8108_LOCUS1474 [Phakopsora pachyrhizi]|uniref:Uncharacterized protein n=1 Tax=Phakopsora pachyrhizi TaxID=170000 RepID=A0AAV0AJX3_PHAPC|nr:hypothetical protein PPACK8108_LOCUS1474 [Phakopsora pachyrhizi]